MSSFSIGIRKINDLETTKQSLEKWHQMIQTGDMSNLNELLADDVVFRSSVAFKPYEENMWLSDFDQCNSRIFSGFHLSPVSSTLKMVKMSCWSSVLMVENRLKVLMVCFVWNAQGKNH